MEIQGNVLRSDLEEGTQTEIQEQTIKTGSSSEPEQRRTSPAPLRQGNDLSFTNAGNQRHGEPAVIRCAIYSEE